MLRLYLFKKNKGGDAIRGTTMINEDGIEATVWSVHDFLCVIAGKSTKTSHGRVMLKRLEEQYGDLITSKCVTLALEGKAEVPTMDTLDITWLLFTLKHSSPDRAQRAHKHLLRILQDDIREFVVKDKDPAP